ncbi:isopenicillin N synthase family oxygenase [Patescibacteria group bacterium]|nr:isopenicillin N synthase family oxygenase [Patescibacteria group bacterium]
MVANKGVPVVDMRTGGSEFTKRLGDGLENFGFVAIVNHGIETRLLKQAYDTARRVFVLPTEIKNKYQTPETGRQVGYTPFQMEHAKDSDLPDLKEFWHIVRPGNRSYLNVYPREVPDFEMIMPELFRALDKISVHLLTSIRDYLNYRTDKLTEMVNGGNSILRILHYPNINSDVEGMRSAPHEDINLLTLMVAATTPGLEIKNRQGEWIPVNNPPNSIIVNSGDMLELYTFGRISSATHRVVNPDKPDGGRYSLPFFVMPRPETALVTAGCFLEQRLRDNRVMS